jgi:hypothetical protein
MFWKSSRALQPGFWKPELCDLSGEMEISPGLISLPLNLDEVASCLRLETYAGQMHDQGTRLGAHSFVRKIYYWSRPIMPVSVRSILQRVKLRGQLKNPFPKWPVDRSVDPFIREGDDSSNSGEWWSTHSLHLVLAGKKTGGFHPHP